MPVPKGSTIDPARTRAAIIDAATPVLYERGIDGIGVAGLCTRIGISKETLYRHFGTKDGLVRVVLETRSERFLGWLSEAAAGAGSDPGRQLAAVFGALQEWYDDPFFRGCAMLNAAAQHYDEMVRAITTRHLDGYLELLTGIAEHAGVDDPPTLGRQWLMLIEGATAVAAHQSAGDAGEHGCRAALALLAAALRTDVSVGGGG
ncbi:TetR/AcrR family transcriptional regulator [Actinomadura hibisca]|uniref:TetR/AcrR family transcriptional regulator n=1 Tax=Actinomadura hibisca TaxID=68565 RepID=UPI00082DD7BD|nr:TetR/AcrR family transcriptional regulator [Actinomadura hibisca]